MAEVTFANFSVTVQGLDGIYAIGDGVIEEMARAFGHDLAPQPTEENLGELIGRVGPAKELQTNIQSVQETLGTDQAAVNIARDWVERSGLLAPVERSFVNGEQLDGVVELAIVTGGVRNWMVRRADRLGALHASRGVRMTQLIAGNRVMQPTEGPDVEEGMTEADYMANVIAPNLRAAGMPTTISRAETGVGDEVMAKGARDAKLWGAIKYDTSPVAIVSNAGAWVQNVGQMRRALQREVAPSFDHDGRQIIAVSDGFELGTGVEPTTTHQNPFSALGQIARSAQELVRHNTRA